MTLQGVGMGTTPATTNVGTSTPPPNTLGAGLSVWTNPLSAVTDIPGAFQLATTNFSSYGMFALGILLPVGLVAFMLLGNKGGRR